MGLPSFPVPPESKQNKTKQNVTVQSDARQQSPTNSQESTRFRHTSGKEKSCKSSGKGSSVIPIPLVTPLDGHIRVSSDIVVSA
jgi:hypothetical protein